MHNLQIFCQKIFDQTISILEDAEKNLLTNTEILFDIELETFFEVFTLRYEYEMKYFYSFI